MEKYQSLLKLDSCHFSDYKTFSSEEIFNVFGEEKTDEIKKENASDSADGINAEIVEKNFSQILKVLSELPSYENLKKIFENAKIKSTLSDLEVENEKKVELLKYAPMVRNRLTLLRLLSKGVLA